MCVMVVALSGLVGSLLASSRLQRSSAETASAQRAAVLALEQMQGVPFAEIFASFNSSVADNVGLSSPARGGDFAVAGLSVQNGDLDGACGEIQFPAVDVAGVLQLREDFVDAGMGMPRDLTLDGAVDGLAHNADYRLLPVRVVIRWRGIDGDREIRMETVLCER